MQNRAQVHAKPAVKRGIVMERELWEFAEWQASETGARSASSQIRAWVMEKRDQAKRKAA